MTAGKKGDKYEVCYGGLVGLVWTDSVTLSIIMIPGVCGREGPRGPPVLVSQVCHIQWGWPEGHQM